jgi:hypothetical protein
MAAMGSTGTSSEIKEQYEKMKSLLGGCFFLFSPSKKQKMTAMKNER